MVSLDARWDPIPSSITHPNLSHESVHTRVEWHEAVGWVRDIILSESYSRLSSSMHPYQAIAEHSPRHRRLLYSRCWWMSGSTRRRRHTRHRHSNFERCAIWLIVALSLVHCADEQIHIPIRDLPKCSQVYESRDDTIASVKVRHVREKRMQY